MITNKAEVIDKVIEAYETLGIDYDLEQLVSEVKSNPLTVLYRLAKVITEEN